MQFNLLSFCVGPVAEQVLLLENIGTSVLVGPEQLPSLHRLLLTAASTLQMDPPDLYIKQVYISTLIQSNMCSASMLAQSSAVMTDDSSSMKGLVLHHAWHK